MLAIAGLISVALITAGLIYGILKVNESTYKTEDTFDMVLYILLTLLLGLVSFVAILAPIYG